MFIGIANGWKQHINIIYVNDCRRSPILSCVYKPDQILGIPKIIGTGESEAKAVISVVLCEWKLNNQIKGLCFDTTASNTGINVGTYVKIEQLLQRELWNLSCCHHVLEIILSSVFLKAIRPSSGPNVEIFQNFCLKWSGIDPTKYQVLQLSVSRKYKFTIRIYVITIM